MPRTPWWKRPIVWIVSVVIIGVGAQLQATIQVYVSAILSAVGVTEPGPPIEVLDVHLDPTGAEFVLPNGVNNQELATWDRRNMPSTEWLRAHGAVPVDQVSWEITLVGRRTEAVAITDMKPILEGGQCAASVSGALIQRRPAGGPSGIIDLTAAIDSPDRALKRRDDKGEPQLFFTKNNLLLPAGEKNTLAIITTTAGPYCRWTLDVEYLADGGRQTMTITAPGEEPFSVTGKLDPSKYEPVFIACDKSYLQVSGTEYAEISSGSYDPCSGQ
ncbi:MAG: hypothetical protein ACRDRG_22035 [Pseudonocardiaceae bacterium]